MTQIKLSKSAMSIGSNLGFFVVDQDTGKRAGFTPGVGDGIIKWCLADAPDPTLEI